MVKFTNRKVLFKVRFQTEYDEGYKIFSLSNILTLIKIPACRITRTSKGKAPSSPSAPACSSSRRGPPAATRSSSPTTTTDNSTCPKWFSRSPAPRGEGGRDSFMQTQLLQGQFIDLDLLLILVLILEACSDLDIFYWKKIENISNHLGKYDLPQCYLRSK